MSRLKKLLAVFGTVVGFVALTVSPAQAVNNDTISVYYDSPFVQGTYVTGSGTTVETFDAAPLGACPTTLAVGTLTGSCLVSTAGQYGGAVTDSSTATVGGSGTRYASTTTPTNSMTVTLAAQSKYFGFWWSAGSPTNTVQFYNNNQLVITLTTQTIMSQFGTAPSTWPGANTFTALNGSTYNKGWYFGNPRGYASTSPTQASTITAGEPFVYLHLFASGNLTFNKVVLSGGGFEFDNLAVSTNTQTPDQRLVLAQTILGNHAVTFNNNTGSGSMADQVANSSTALTANSFTKTGYSFTGWNTQANGQGTAYTNQEVYSFDEPLTLYAQWQLIPYTVTYDSQGGSSVSNGSYTIGSTINLASPPTRQGYTFTGWFTNPTGGTALGSTYSPSGTGNITLYAQWTANQTALAETGSTASLAWSSLLFLMAGASIIIAGLALRKSQN